MSTAVRVLACSATVAGAIACGSAASSPSALPVSVAPAGGRIVVLGDSLAVSPSRSDNFARELQKRLEATGPGWVVTNAGISGDTTGGGLARFDRDVPADTRILILELGANDGLRRVEIAKIEQNLSALIERAQARGMRVLLCGMETPPSQGWTYTLDFHRLFPRVADRYRVPLVPFLLAGVALDPEMNGEDGFHPNSAGARRIAETVWPYLEPLVLAPTAASR
jgi:acyl-CoA thioesterase I